MSRTIPVDFDTFYYIQLLESIEKQGKEKFPDSRQQELQRFVEFLLEGDNPVENIEKLAGASGTSDVSIFFSDLMERIHSFPPEEALEKITEYVQDFLTLYEELVQDPAWKTTVEQELFGMVPTPEAGFYFTDFVIAEMRDRFTDFTEEERKTIFPLLDNLFERIDGSGSIETVLSPYRGAEDLKQLVKTLEELFSLPPNRETLEQYISQFPLRLKDFSDTFRRLAVTNLNLLRNFCEGKPAELVETETDRELEEMLQDVRQKEAQPSRKEALSEEEKQLRLLLRDYILHEIEGLIRELLQNVSDFNREPGNPEKQSAVLNGLKLFKDLGKIHKYPGIEKASGDIQSALEQFFKKEEPLSNESVSELEKMGEKFSAYIDFLLNDREEEGNQALQEARDRFIRTLKGEEEGAPAEEIPFSHREILQPEFENINSRFLREIENHFRQLAADKTNAEVLDNVLRHLNHLQNWYGIWKLAGAAELVATIQTALENTTQRENLLADLAPVNEAVAFLSNKLFEAEPAMWKALALQISGEELQAEPVDVGKSLEAFQEITRRQLQSVIDALGNTGVSYLGVINDYYKPRLKQVVSNAALIKNEELQQIGNYLLQKIDLFVDLPEELQNYLRNLLREKLEWVSRSISELPGAIPADEMIRECDELFEDLLRKADSLTAKEEPSVSEKETVIDDELLTVFARETRKYLEEVDNYLDRLEKDLGDQEALNRLGSVIHTLKGSAQMLSQQPIAEFAAPMDHLLDRISDGELKVSEQLVPLFREAVAAIRKRLDKEEVDSEPILSSLNEYMETHRVSAAAEEAPLKPEPEITGEETVEEIPEQKEPVPAEPVEEQEDMVRLSEQDPELLEIFRSEAQNNIAAIQENLSLIEKFTYDKQSLQTLDQAIHEVRAAAKMLGFAEIGSLMDKVQQAVELVVEEKGANLGEVIPVLRKAIQVVNELAEKNRISREVYDKTVSAVDAILSGESPEAVEEEEVPVAEATVSEEKPRVLEPSAQVLEAFYQEAREHLEDINFLLMKMEKDPENEEFARHLMRTLHTLKGSAAMVYLEPVEKLAHLSEDIVERFLEKEEPISQQAFDLLFEVVDEIEFIIDSQMHGLKGKTRNFADIVERLQSLLGEVTPASEELPPEGKEAPKETPPSEKKEFLSITDELETGKVAPRDAYVRLHVNQMDTLLNEAAELVINHTQFKKQVEKLKNYLPRLDVESKNLQNVLWYLETIMNEEKRIIELVQNQLKDTPAVAESQKNQIENIQRTMHNLRVFYDNFIRNLQGIKDSSKAYEEQIHKITQLSTHIHEEIMQARLVPIGMLFQRFHRPLRDLARKYNKKIKLYVEGESTELDRVLIEELYEPLLHILRNAIGHGIELPQERKKAGKSEEGLIRISATHDRNFVTVEIADDGRGIDVEKVKAKAIELGLLSESAAGEATVQEIFEFLMHPGFSTADGTDRLSGRGVGLDVVKNQIQKIKGDIRIYSEKGRGTRFLIRVPISLTVTQAMLVEVSGQVYAIPLLQVEETTNVAVTDLQREDQRYYMFHRGGKIPVRILSNILQTRGEKHRPVTLVGEYPVIIVQDEGRKVALLVDKIVHREEILIKSLGAGLRRVQYITGGSVLADGKVVLVLDVAQIVRDSFKPSDAESEMRVMPTAEVAETMMPTGRPGKKAKMRRQIIEGRKPQILVVDDSISIRKFLSGLLTQNGYQVEMAKNGHNALEKLNEQEYDLVITDLEMPHMTGYELIEKIRSEERWDNLPIIVLTGRASKHIRQVTENLGADEFIIKPFKENELLEKISTFLVVKS